MAISLLTGAAGNANLDAVFDPYVQGTSPPATGLLDDTSVDIATRYAPVSFGTQAAATSLLTEQSGNADINTLFAAYGTAQYALTCKGVAYLASTPTAASCNIQFNFDTSTWSVSAGTTFSGTPTSGNLNAGATQYYLTHTDNLGINGIVSVNAAVGVWTNLAAGLYVKASDSGPGSDICKSTITLQLRNAGGTVLSTTTFSVAAKYTGI